jgi:hypothetical protein
MWKFFSACEKRDVYFVMRQDQGSPTVFYHWPPRFDFSGDFWGDLLGNNVVNALNNMPPYYCTDLKKAKQQCQILKEKETLSSFSIYKFDAKLDKKCNVIGHVSETFERI